MQYETLKALENDRQNKDVAKQYGISGSTLTTWKKNKEKIFDAFENSSVLNEALLKWFTSTCGNNIPINRPFLLEKADEFAKAFDYKDFTASTGWLRGWKER